MKIKTTNVEGKSYLVLPESFADMLFARMYAILPDSAKEKLNLLCLQLIRLSYREGFYKDGNILCQAEVMKWIKSTIDANAYSEELPF